MFFRTHPHLIIKTMMPNLIHIIPITNNTMLNWIFQTKYTSFSKCFFTNKTLFVLHTTNYVLKFWSAYYWWEWCSWSILATYTCFAHSGTIVDYDWGVVWGCGHFMGWVFFLLISNYLYVWGRLILYILLVFRIILAKDIYIKYQL